MAVNNITLADNDVYQTGSDSVKYDSYLTQMKGFCSKCEYLALTFFCKILKSFCSHFTEIDFQKASPTDTAILNIQKIIKKASKDFCFKAINPQ